MRDGDQNRYKGKGVLKAVGNVNQVLGPALEGMDPLNQEEIDKKIISMDGTENKEKLGANSILAISMVVAKAATLATTKATTADISKTFFVVFCIFTSLRF